MSDMPELFIDDDGDVCINDNREFNLVFCPAVHDDGGEQLCPDVVQEIVRRYNEAPALRAQIATLTAERAEASQAFGVMEHFAVVLTEADGKYVSVRQRDYEALRAALAAMEG